MFALRRGGVCRPLHGFHPNNHRSFVQNLCNGFLDLAIALPLPPSLPPYSTTIILTTIVARVAILPVAIWSKRRNWRLEELALPELKRMGPIVSKRVLEEMRDKGLRGDKAYLKKAYRERLTQVMKNMRGDLLRKYNCQPLPSILSPPLTQLPIFVMGTVILGKLSQDPTPFDAESFLTLSTLAHPDPTMTLPIVLGILTMSNVESSNWVMNAAERERERQIDERNDGATAEGGKVIRPKKVIRSTLRGLSVVRIVVAAMAPGSITLFWVTSTAFGLLQTWIMEWQDIRRRRRNEISVTESIAASPKPSQPKKVATGVKRRIEVLDPLWLEPGEPSLDLI